MEQSALKRDVVTFDVGDTAAKSVDLGRQSKVKSRYALAVRNTTDVKITVVLFNQETFSDDAEVKAEMARFDLEAAEAGVVIVEGLFLGDSSHVSFEPVSSVNDPGTGVFYVLREAS